MTNDEWADVREQIIETAKITRANLMKGKLLRGVSDWPLLSSNIQYNYILDAARDYFEQMYAEIAAGEDL